jgi:hypothetical protein
MTATQNTEHHIQYRIVQSHLCIHTKAGINEPFRKLPLHRDGRLDRENQTRARSKSVLEASPLYV